VPSVPTTWDAALLKCLFDRDGAVTQEPPVARGQAQQLEPLRDVWLSNTGDRCEVPLTPHPETLHRLFDGLGLLDRIAAPQGANFCQQVKRIRWILLADQADDSPNARALNGVESPVTIDHDVTVAVRRTSKDERTITSASAVSQVAGRLDRLEHY
jgi:hypothetical protein